MTEHDLEMYTASANATLLEASEKILNNRSRCVCVMEDEKVIGMFSQGDVIRALLKDINPYVPLASIIKPSFIYLRERNLEEALELVRKRLITLIPIVDEDFHLQDIITIGQLIDAMEFKKE